jgi:flavin-binding protein dodecin
VIVVRDDYSGVVPQPVQVTATLKQPSHRISTLHPSPQSLKVFGMSDHIYKKIELVGSSKNSIEDAAQNAVNKASESIRNMRWMEVGEIRGHLVDGAIDHWQVGVKIGFTLEDEDAPETLDEKKS